MAKLFRDLELLTSEWIDISGERYVMSAAEALLDPSSCITTSAMTKEAVVTVRLDAKLDRELDRLSKSLGQSKSAIARDALKRQVALALS